ncbi:hypothetical protein [Neisseria musculi]|uniref:Uncharacterized protein n=1 Tax=Neisseria musculi TaxID=1815583 RepID=A0A7H1MCC0_9NEIS|nr:hypothetical protein [Neisseria musculi]QNT59285.1 hypothetical protein H7A79_1044 [Neisseria musculi]
MSKAEKIRKATLAAVAQRDAYVNETTDDIAEMYRKAADDMAAQIRGSDGRRIEPLELHALLQATAAVLRRLNTLRDARLENDLNTLAVMAGMPFGDTLTFSRRERAKDAAVSFVKNFVHSDGLQLSDRLWRLSRHAADTVAEHLKAAVGNGDDAFHAVMGSLGSGADVPPHIAKAYDASRAGALRQSLRDIMTGSPDPTTGGGVVYQAERLFRTELIRAHGEAYMGMAFETEGVRGVRFMLSPRHPKPDICDTHASSDLYGLGAGVYPNRESCPWPAHPNTFSYVVAVFDDEAGGSGKDKAESSAKTQYPSVYEDSFPKSYQSLKHHVDVLKARGADTDRLRRELGQKKRWVAAGLSSEQKSWLNTQAGYVFLSDETLIKQFAHHAGQPVFMKHYLNLQHLIDNAQVVARSNESSVMFFQEDERVMKAVLKTTRDGSEVYLTSLHVSDMKAVKRALKKETVFKNEYGSL